MPFIKGRFHINPIAGQALEAAREAEAAQLALEHAAQHDRQRDGGGESDGANNDAAAPPEGPIHRVEIEASEMVPTHSGRAVRGFVARVHRQPAATSQAIESAGQGMNDEADPWRGSGNASGSQRTRGATHETHVFADHRDLVSFLRDELAKDCK
jgi:hypothetical protein